MKTIISPRAVCFETLRLMDKFDFKPGEYRAWLSDEWLFLPLDEFSTLLLARLKEEPPRIDEDTDPEGVEHYANLSASFRAFRDVPGIHVRGIVS
jgi:hypothetical protein